MSFQEYLQQISFKFELKEIKSPSNGAEVNVKVYYAWRDVRVNAISESSRTKLSNPFTVTHRT